MARVTRSRRIAADSGRVWELVSDPHSLPRWWPRAQRVEDVREPDSGTRARWTVVLETERGTGVRADYRCVRAEYRRRYAWEQEIEGTPFERIIHGSGLEIELTATHRETEVAMTSDERLRGLSRLGSTMIRGAAKRRLDEALDGIERALVGEPESAA